MVEDQPCPVPVSNMNLPELIETRIRRWRTRSRTLFQRLQHLLDVYALVREFLLRPLIGLLRFIEKLAHL